MNKIKHDTIIISDIHLGSPMCQAKELLVFLQSIEVKRLVLNGDIFEDLKRTYRLHRDHWAVLNQLRSMSDNCEVVWVKGNHDTIHRNKKEDLIALSNLLGIKMKYQLVFNVGEIRCLAIHGDKWDNYIYKYPMLSSVVTWIYDRSKELFTGRTRNIIKWIKRKSKLLMRNSNFVMSGAVDYAEDLECNMVVCGHTHQAMLEKVGPVAYGNCGTWESFTPTYVTIDEDKARLWKYENNNQVLVKELEWGTK